MNPSRGRRGSLVSYPSSKIFLSAEYQCVSLSASLWYSAKVKSSQIHSGFLKEKDEGDIKSTSAVTMVPVISTSFSSE